MSLKIHQAAHPGVLCTNPFQFLMLHTYQMLDLQTSTAFLPKNTNQMIPLMISRCQKNLDKSANVRNVAVKLVQEEVPESTAKVLARIVGMWTVQGAIANILTRGVQLVRISTKMMPLNLSCTTSCKYDYCGLER